LKGNRSLAQRKRGEKGEEKEVHKESKKEKKAGPMTKGKNVSLRPRSAAGPIWRREKTTRERKVVRSKGEQSTRRSERAAPRKE